MRIMMMKSYSLGDVESLSPYLCCKKKKNHSYFLLVFLWKFNFGFGHRVRNLSTTPPPKWSVRFFPTLFIDQCSLSHLLVLSFSVFFFSVYSDTKIPSFLFLFRKVTHMFAWIKSTCWIPSWSCPKRHLVGVRDLVFGVWFSTMQMGNIDPTTFDFKFHLDVTRPVGTH